MGKVLAGDDLATEPRYRDAYYRGAQELILDPLGLEGTTPLVGRQHANLVQGYAGTHPAVPDSVDKMITPDDLFYQDPTWEFSGGGLVTSPPDLAHLIRGLAKGLLYTSPADRERFVEVFTTQGPVDSAAGFSYGFSPFLIQAPSVGRLLAHGGQYPGYQSYVAYLQDHDVAVAIQVNSWQNHKLFDYLGQLVPIVLERLHRPVR